VAGYRRSKGTWAASSSFPLALYGLWNAREAFFLSTFIEWSPLPLFEGIVI
jgi:hypothetical protein